MGLFDKLKNMASQSFSEPAGQDELEGISAEEALLKGKEFQNQDQKDEAEKWLLHAALQNHTEAMEELAFLYISEKRPEEAFHWAQAAFQRSEETGFKVGASAFAVCLCDGIGCEKDPEQGVELLRKTADAGSAHSCRCLSELHFGGLYVNRDLWESSRYLELEYELTHDFATRMMVDEMFYSLDPAELLPEYEEIVKENSQKACDAMYQARLNGDFEEASKWFFCLFPVFVNEGGSKNFFSEGSGTTDEAHRPTLALKLAKAGVEKGDFDSMFMYGHKLKVASDAGDKAIDMIESIHWLAECIKNPEITIFTHHALCELGILAYLSDDAEVRKNGIDFLFKAGAIQEEHPDFAKDVDATEILNKILHITTEILSKSKKENEEDQPSQPSAPEEQTIPQSPAASKLPPALKTPFLSVLLYAAVNETDYWTGTVPTKIINRDRTGIAMFNLLLKRPILQAGDYTLKYVFTDDNGNPLSEGKTVFSLGVGNDRLAQAFLVQNDPEGLYHVTFSIEELGMPGLPFTYAVVSDAAPSPASLPVYLPSVSSVEAVAAAAMKGTNDGADYWGGVDLPNNTIDQNQYRFAMFQIFTPKPYTGDALIELRMVIRDSFGNVIRDDCTELEVHAGYDRFAKSLPLVLEDGKRFGSDNCTAEFSVNDSAPLIFPFAVTDSALL